MRGGKGNFGPRPGVSLLELLLVIALMGVLGSALATAFIGVQRFVRSYSQDLAAGEARRVATSILAEELRYINPETDIQGHGADSVALRVFRGAGIVCSADSKTVTVRYRGIRAPEPAKDSVLVVGEDGVGALDVSNATSSGCDVRPGERLYRWTLAAPPKVGSLLLVFESGSYHLHGGALRYRRGDSGRQPLTEELFDDRAARMEWMAGTDEEGGESIAGVALDLTTRPRVGGGRREGRGSRHWIHLRNGGP